MYIYIYTWKTIKTTFSVHTGLDIFFVSYVFSQIRPCPAANPLLTGQFSFLLNSWICRTGSDSMSVSSRDSIWGSMLTFAYCFFSTWCWKNTSILWVHPNLVGNMAVFVARFGRPWVPDHDSQLAPLRTEIPLLETVGGCPNPVLSKGFEQPFTIKNQNTQLNQKNSVRCW